MSKDSSENNFDRPWLVIVVTILIFFISQFVAVFLVALGKQLLHPHTSLSSALSGSAPAQFFYVLIAEGLAAALTIFVVRRVMRQHLSVIGLGRRPKFADIGRAMWGFAAFYVLLIVSSIIISLFVPGLNTKEAQNVGFNTLNSPLDYVLAFSALVFLPPLGEETLMRGYLYSGLRARLRFTSALLVTSVLFGLAHLGSGTNGSPLWLAGLDTFLLSVVLVYLRERTGALYAGMLVHAANNLIAFGVHFHALIF